MFILLRDIAVENITEICLLPLFNLDDDKGEKYQKNISESGYHYYGGDNYPKLTALEPRINSATAELRTELRTVSSHLRVFDKAAFWLQPYFVELSTGS